VVNTLDKQYLASIIKILGEEKDGRIIANKIARYRKKKPIKTSEELASIINEAKKSYNNYKKNPATKTFQAIRIFVNKELTELMLGLIEASKLLSKGGILIVVSFHSLEDRIVKRFIKNASLESRQYRGLPDVPVEFQPKLKIIGKAVRASIAEIGMNVRSRSAVLRIAERI
jgi:16S rRNA (cytosine1402-N4)-methyltransferase